MAFEIQTSHRRAGQATHVVYALTDSADTRAEIWPSLGGNCLRWSVAGRDGPTELLYAAPDWEENPLPTRSGVPVLFPFPNRIRDGRFDWDGKAFQLPRNCPQQKHAIHGFACRHRWRVLDSGAAGEQAWIKMAFEPARDAPAVVPQWPGEYRLELAIILRRAELDFSASVENLGNNAAPWGLGYHPYFLLHGAEPRVSTAADRLWELQDFLPTGRLLPIPEEKDLRTPRAIRELQCDDLYRMRAGQTASGQTHVECGRIAFSGEEQLAVSASPEFRELVVFIPPHRKSICLEPYTCATDAINLQGIDSGLQLLPRGERRALSMKLTYESKQKPR